MTALAATQNFNDWLYSSSGDGSFTKSGNKWLLQSGLGTGASLLSKKIPARPGETITFRCYGRLWSGGYGTSGGITIEYPTQGNIVTSATFTKDWQLIECSYTVPAHATRLEYVRLTAGLGTNEGGGIEVLYPSIDVTGAVMGFSRLWACALIDLTASGGTIGFSSSFANIGVTDLSYDATNKDIKFKIPISNNGNQIAPIITAQLFSGNALNVSARVISHSRDSGETVVRLIDTTTGAAVAATPSIVSMTVQAIGI